MYCMLNNPHQPSRFLLETAAEAMDSLIDGASEFYRSFYVIEKLHTEKGLPCDEQRLGEMKELILGLRKMLYDERASLQCQLSSISDIEEAEQYLAGLRAKAEAGRTPKQ